jgi:PPM family protein phosphatase
MIATTYAALTDRGRVREVNEDRWFADPRQGLYLVADGMGGSYAGGLAAEAVATVLPRLLSQKLKRASFSDEAQAVKQLLGVVSEMSQLLRRESQQELGLKGVGSTVVLVMVRDGHALVAHLGDSRVYLLRANGLEQLTHDHSMLQLLLDCGEIGVEEVAGHPARGQLTRYVGMPGEPLPECCGLELHAGDRLLLCTDGLTGMLSDGEIRAILGESLPPQATCARLIAAANEAGGKDNITALVLSVSEPSR